METQRVGRYGKPFGVRPDRDVQMLMERAITTALSEFRNPNRLANIAIRALLTGRFATKQIRALQQKMKEAA